MNLWTKIPRDENAYKTTEEPKTETAEEPIDLLNDPRVIWTTTQCQASALRKRCRQRQEAEEKDKETK